MRSGLPLLTIITIKNRETVDAVLLVMGWVGTVVVESVSGIGVVLRVASLSAVNAIAGHTDMKLQLVLYGNWTILKLQCHYRLQTDVK